MSSPGEHALDGTGEPALLRWPEIRGGDPSDEALAAFESAENLDGETLDAFVRAVLDAAAVGFEANRYGCARITRPGVEDKATGDVVYHRRYELVTGGWSANEAILAHLPLLVRALAWESSHRGGLHVFEVRE